MLSAPGESRLVRNIAEQQTKPLKTDAHCGHRDHKLRNLVVAAWRERFGNTNARIGEAKEPHRPLDDMNEDFAAAVLRFAQQTDNEAMDEFVRPFAAQ